MLKDREKVEKVRPRSQQDIDLFRGVHDGQDPTAQSTKVNAVRPITHRYNRLSTKSSSPKSQAKKQGNLTREKTPKIVRSF